MTEPRARPGVQDEGYDSAPYDLLDARVAKDEKRVCEIFDRLLGDAQRFFMACAAWAYVASGLYAAGVRAGGEFMVAESVEWGISLVDTGERVEPEEADPCKVWAMRFMTAAVTADGDNMIALLETAIGTLELVDGPLVLIDWATERWAEMTPEERSGGG